MSPHTDTSGLSVATSERQALKLSEGEPMQFSRSWSSKALSWGVAAIVAGGSPLVVKAAPALPDPCKLITAAELVQIAGPLKGAAKPGDIASGDVSCGYTPANGPAWISVRLHDGDLGAWKRRTGGQNPVMLPEFGKDAFLNPGTEGSADLYARKGSLILRVSLPKGPTAVDMVKAVAKKAL
jgi:hypothetical protein